MATLTVEALRCFQCQRPLHPVEPWYRRQMVTAVERSQRLAVIERYELVNLCEQCEEGRRTLDAEQQREGGFWILFLLATMVALVVEHAMPGGSAIFCLLLIACGIWRWRRKQRSAGRAEREQER